MTPAPVGHHCPECVARDRRETRRIRPRLPRGLSVTMVLLGINVGVYLLGVLLGAATGDRGAFLRAGAMIPALVAQGEWWRLLTAMFLHISTLHLLLNSLALYIFGAMVESAFGRLRFLALYLLTGFAGSAASFAFGNPAIAAAGASGAIFGLLGAWLAYNLRRHSLSLARSNVQGALMLIGLNLVLGFTLPGIDNLAHIGGLVAGIAAGAAAEGFGRRAMRTLTQAGGLAIIALASATLVVWRVADLTS